MIYNAIYFFFWQINCFDNSIAMRIFRFKINSNDTIEAASSDQIDPDWPSSIKIKKIPFKLPFD